MFKTKSFLFSIIKVIIFQPVYSFILSKSEADCVLRGDTEDEVMTGREGFEKTPKSFLTESQDMGNLQRR